MGLFKELLRRLGLSRDAHIEISAPGIEVTISGDPDQVRSLLAVVKYEIERSLREKERVQEREAGRALPDGTRPRSSGQFVQPSELDEMDSPYALGARVVPVEGDDGRGKLEQAVLRFSSEPTLDPEPKTPARAEDSLDSADSLNRERAVTAVLARPTPAGSPSLNQGDLSALALLVRNASEPSAEDVTREITQER